MQFKKKKKKKESDSKYIMLARELDIGCFASKRFGVV